MRFEKLNHYFLNNRFQFTLFLEAKRFQENLTESTRIQFHIFVGIRDEFMVV